VIDMGDDRKIADLEHMKRRKWHQLNTKNVPSVVRYSVCATHKGGETVVSAPWFRARKETRILPRRVPWLLSYRPHAESSVAIGLRAAPVSQLVSLGRVYLLTH